MDVVARTIHHPATTGIDLASVLRVLGDPVRLEIVRLLATLDECTCSTIQAHLDIPTSTGSYHLRLLREAGVTRTRASGTERRISLRRDDLDERFPGLVASIVGAGNGDGPG
ncbi:MAG: transcriptional regulator, ArsR family [Thermoleophilia bacterium]|nr:transcriptional regulator, ArsR family [Thermoleophilia bacterium]